MTIKLYCVMLENKPTVSLLRTYFLIYLYIKKNPFYSKAMLLFFKLISFKKIWRN